MSTRIDVTYTFILFKKSEHEGCYYTRQRISGKKEILWFEGHPSTDGTFVSNIGIPYSKEFSDKLEQEYQCSNARGNYLLALFPIPVILVFSLMFIIPGPIRESMKLYWREPQNLISYGIVLIVFISSIFLTIKYYMKYKKMLKVINI